MKTETIRLEAIEKSLSAREAMRLAELEHRIVQDFAVFYQVGKALTEINELRLYRNKEGRTFEQYCRELWDMSKSTAYQLIDASTVCDCLKLSFDHGSSAIGGETQFADNGLSAIGGHLPLNERQVRPMTKLKDHPEQLMTIWTEATKTAPNGKITASHINKTVKEYLGEKIVKAVHRAQKKVSAKASPEFIAAFEEFSRQILTERTNNYKYTSRGEIIKALDQLRADLAEDGDLIEDTVFRGGTNDANKLERAGFSMFRMDRSSMTIKQRNENGGWVKYSGGYETLKTMEAAFKEILLDDMHLVG